MVQAEAEGALAEWGAELLEGSGVPRKGLVKQGWSVQGLRKARPELRSPEKSGGEGSFGLVRCLDGAAGTREGGLTGGRDGGIGGRATVGTGAVMS